MSLGAIPDYQQSARQMTQQMGKEVHHLRGADGSLVELEIEVPPRDAGDGREHLPVEMILQHWGLSARGPGAHPMGPLAQPALVDEDDGAPLFAGFFLISGQRFCFHSRIFSSSRSSARPTGRWQLQPNCRRMRQACEAW